MPLSDLELFQRSPVVTRISRVESDQDGANGDIRVKILIELVNGWQMDCWERTSPGFRRYAFHILQENQMITRWDNAPHHGQIETFPHHQHIGASVLPSEDMNAAKVLARLETMI
jgi:hypothetical protein